MARQLWILRHGDAEAHGARPDPERELTPTGIAQSKAAGRALVALGVDMSLAFASPKVRARDTAKLACEALALAPVEHQPLASGFDRGDALELVGAMDDGQRLLVVGHEPDLSQVIHDLCGARVDLKKGGVAAIRMTGSTGGELLALLRPRELKRIGRE